MKKKNNRIFKKDGIYWKDYDPNSSHIADIIVKDRKFELYFSNNAFSLFLIQDFDTMLYKAKKDESLKLFFDVPSIEDVDENIDVFTLITLSKKAIVDYILKYNLNYFMFSASTERKALIYKRLAKHIVLELNERYDKSNMGFEVELSNTEDNREYYFYKKAK